MFNQNVGYESMQHSILNENSIHPSLSNNNSAIAVEPVLLSQNQYQSRQPLIKHKTFTEVDERDEFDDNGLPQPESPNLLSSNKKSLLDSQRKSEITGRVKITPGKINEMNLRGSFQIAQDIIKIQKGNETVEKESNRNTKLSNQRSFRTITVLEAKKETTPRNVARG